MTTYEGIKNINVRFFTARSYGGEDDINEIDHVEFESIYAPILYERHSVHWNGVRQICLTKVIGD